MMTCYPGGKNSPGVYQRIISLQPPHVEYVEPFLGSGAIMRRKLPAVRNVGIDVDAGVVESWRAFPGCHVVCADGADWLRLRTEGRNWRGDELVYCDPPYLFSARASDRRRYAHEFGSEAEHAALLRILTSIPAMVQISGYRSPLYCRALSSWGCEEYQVMTRGGRTVTETLWFNYPRPARLHDYRFLGKDFHERLRIRRKIARLVEKLAWLPELERAAVIAGVSDGAHDGSSNVQVGDAGRHASPALAMAPGGRPPSPQPALLQP